MANFKVLLTYFNLISTDSQLSMYEWNDDKMYPRMIKLKEKNPDLKILLAVGGWNHESGWNHENGGTSKHNFSVLNNICKIIIRF